MDSLRSSSGNVEDNLGIPDELRCKRSDGKQWRCTAMSMPDKTVCEKHYIQAKRRAANSALRASLKKAKRKALGEEGDMFLDNQDDDSDAPVPSNIRVGDYPVPASLKNYKDKGFRNQLGYSSELSLRGMAMRQSLEEADDDDDLGMDYDCEEDLRSHRTPPFSAVESSRNGLQRSFGSNGMEYSDDGPTESSEEIGGDPCHQCHKRSKNGILWCLKCDRRGYCNSCISAWYSDLPLEEIEKACPACRGICYCRVCLRGDNMVKIRIRELPVLDKLQYLYCILSSVLPVVKQIHQDQCVELELEKKLHGNDIELFRAKLNADEQMCCNICRIPIIDYHRHCMNCSYDLCLQCCQDLRGASATAGNGEVAGNHIDGKMQAKETPAEQVKLARPRLGLSKRYPLWKANTDGSIPCPPKDYGGCGYSPLNLIRIFKLNWVAKLRKNAEEIVSGCRLCDTDALENCGWNNSSLNQYAHRDGCNDNFLYCPSSEDIKAEGIHAFRKHWVRGEPIIVKHVFDSASMSSWDPMVILKGIRETSDEKMKKPNRLVKGIDCLSWSEVDIELDEFVRGYSEGQVREDGTLEMLKLKDWPSPSASEEFLLYQRPQFISKVPLLEYIHSRLGVLNVAAKLPHYSLQNDAGPKIYISYGTYEELGGGDSVTNLHFKMRDMVYILMHTNEVKPKGWQGNESPWPKTSLEEGTPSDLAHNGHSLQNEAKMDVDNNERMEDQHIEATTMLHDVERTKDERVVNAASVGKVNRMEDLRLKGDGESFPETHPGVHWDVFRRQDVPKLIDYLQKLSKDTENPTIQTDDYETHFLYTGTVFLNVHQKRELKEEFGVEPWSFEQHFGQAVFIPAGCPFQTRNLQCTVQLGLDFLSPESLGQATRLAEEIRCLPNDNEAKLQVLEVGKISLYAASLAIKEVQKLVLDPKLGAEIRFEDPNLTAAVSENLEQVANRRQISCA